METMIIRAAAINWKIKNIVSDSEFWNHGQTFLSQAHEDGAQLVVLPELFCLELLHLAKKVAPDEAPKYLVQYESAIQDWLTRMSSNSGMVIVGGSHFTTDPESGEITNVSMIAFPDGSRYFQPKNKLTVYERSTWKLRPGMGLTQLPGKLGVSVCYDCEFPEGTRKLALAGMLIHAVPAWTETRRGFQRVRWSCLARAVENQTFVIHSSLVGDIGREPVPESFGSSAIITPSIAPFPMEAILAETALNEDGVVVSGMDLDTLRAARIEGEVTNWIDRDDSTWVLGASLNALAPWEAPDGPNGA
jgi:predicted amidohydrolase